MNFRSPPWMKIPLGCARASIPVRGRFVCWCREPAQKFGPDALFEPPIVATLVVSTHGRLISLERLAGSDAR